MTRTAARREAERKAELRRQERIRKEAARISAEARKRAAQKEAARKAELRRQEAIRKEAARISAEAKRRAAEKAAQQAAAKRAAEQAAAKRAAQQKAAQQQMQNSGGITSGAGYGTRAATGSKPVHPAIQASVNKVLGRSAPSGAGYGTRAATAPKRPWVTPTAHPAVQASVAKVLGRPMPPKPQYTTGFTADPGKYVTKPKKPQYTTGFSADPGQYVGNGVTKEWQEYRDAQNKKHAEERARTVRDDPSRYVSKDKIVDSYVQADGTTRNITWQDRHEAKQRIKEAMKAPITGVSYGGAQSQAYSDGENRNVVLRDQASIDKWKREEEDRKKRAAISKAQREQMMNSGGITDPRGAANNSAAKQQMQNSGGITSPGEQQRMRDIMLDPWNVRGTTVMQGLARGNNSSYNWTNSPLRVDSRMLGNNNLTGTGRMMAESERQYVRNMQKELGVPVTGVWNQITQKAYEKRMKQLDKVFYQNNPTAAGIPYDSKNIEANGCPTTSINNVMKLMGKNVPYLQTYEWNRQRATDAMPGTIPSQVKRFIEQNVPDVKVQTAVLSKPKAQEVINQSGYGILCYTYKGKASGNVGGHYVAVESTNNPNLPNQVKVYDYDSGQIFGENGSVQVFKSIEAYFDQMERESGGTNNNLIAAYGISPK